MNIKKSIKNIIIQDSIRLAENWQNQIQDYTISNHRKHQNELSNIVKDKKSKNILITLFDQAFRSGNKKRIADQFVYILKKHGIPDSFSTFEKVLLSLFKFIGIQTSLISVPLLKNTIFKKTAHVIIDQNNDLKRHLLLNKKKGIQLNLNFLGEVVLGEKEALKSLNKYIDALKNPNINYISIKISNLCTFINPLSYDYYNELIISRLSQMFRYAKENYVLEKGEKKSKYIFLDMEEYRNFHSTYFCFTTVLSKSEFKNVRAGIVLQAYLPESFNYYNKLLKWSSKRIKNGGSPIKVRLVKGANLQQELTESSLHGWVSPIYNSKLETDANFKKILEVAIKPENIKKVHLGIGSHNLFDITYAVILAKHYKINNNLSFEMLNGIAGDCGEIVKQESKDFLLYTPTSERSRFINAIGYLVRRLDENSSKENFLHYSNSMKVDSNEWNFLKNQFCESANNTSKVENKPIHFQDRLIVEDSIKYKWKKGVFENEVETDFNLLENQRWIKLIRDKWLSKLNNKADEIPVSIGERDIFKGTYKEFYNHNSLDRSNPIYKVYLSNKYHIFKTLEISEEDPSNWSKSDWKVRSNILSKAAYFLRRRREDLIGCTAITTGKSFYEADIEINEAIDFTEYYPFSYKKLHKEVNFKSSPKGVVLVISPWNFPIAIPVGGIVSALITGNRVILKPSPETMPIAREFIRCFWDAGISKSTLQIINCNDGKDLNFLTNHKAIKHIIFTGSTETAYKILKARPDIPISAETGGKNSIIISPMADIDLAIKNVINSAFSNSGQKCSAASILILHKELFENEDFINRLKDATESLIVGGAFDFKNNISPLIKAPSGFLKDVIDASDNEDFWLVKPKKVNNNSCFLSPGIKWNIKKSSSIYKNELFGPVLGVIKANDFDDAIDIVNQEYGLTSGLESLDLREIEKWKKSVNAGNLYINRGITGAIVQRQAFGGFLNSRSAYGYGIKAGGPNYLIQFMRITEGKSQNFQDINIPKDLEFKIFEKISNTVINYYWWMKSYFLLEDDQSKILGQDNYLIYKKGVKPFMIRINEFDNLEDVLKIICASIICQSNPVISVSQKWNFLDDLMEFKNRFNIYIEKEKKMFKHFNKVCFVRVLNTKNLELDTIKNISNNGLSIVGHKPYINGRFELLWYLQEQSISENFHRYGNLIFREKKIKV
ncbi:MAG: bifunctional proline dehydrogenase/L-glutamate gamma-semialdehyde dehydrogenase [Flavobacteriaceae bacterium]|nr:bifunctional proline dehydrogenase/L-glutamate gamma-semialdehyde dehydrogenase [Flavobacteriaceae bacterium]